MSSGVDISAVVSRLKRQINKKQLKFASLTQEFNAVQEKYIEKDILYNTTVEEIDKIKDRLDSSILELRELAHTLSASGKQRNRLRMRLKHPTKDVTKALEQIMIDEVDNVLTEMDVHSQDLIVKRHHAAIDANEENKFEEAEFMHTTIKITVQNTVPIERDTAFGQLHQNSVNRTKEFYITEGYTYGELADDASIVRAADAGREIGTQPPLNSYRSEV